MFAYPEIDQNLPLAEQKRLALVRRSDKLISWLGRPEYATYVDTDSTEQLAKLINLVIYALESSLPVTKWKPFRQKLMDLKQMLLGIPDYEEKVRFDPDERENYQNAVTVLVSILERYKAVVAGAYLT